MIEATAAGLILFAVGVVLMLGIRRIAWRYAVIAALGMGLVLALVRGWPDMPGGVAVLLAAIGGGLASLGVERGERDRERRAVAILRGSSIAR
jgi:hypothetical protein